MLAAVLQHQKLPRGSRKGTPGARRQHRAATAPSREGSPFWTVVPPGRSNPDQKAPPYPTRLPASDTSGGNLRSYPDSNRIFVLINLRSYPDSYLEARGHLGKGDVLVEVQSLLDLLPHQHAHEGQGIHAKGDEGLQHGEDEVQRAQRLAALEEVLRVELHDAEEVLERREGLVEEGEVHHQRGPEDVHLGEGLEGVLVGDPDDAHVLRRGAAVVDVSGSPGAEGDEWRHAHQEDRQDDDQLEGGRVVLVEVDPPHCRLQRLPSLLDQLELHHAQHVRPALHAAIHEEHEDGGLDAHDNGERSEEDSGEDEGRRQDPAERAEHVRDDDHQNDHHGPYDVLAVALHALAAADLPQVDLDAAIDRLDVKELDHHQRHHGRLEHVGGQRHDVQQRHPVLPQNQAVPEVDRGVDVRHDDHPER
mmetsp:Transcript_84114/g.233113  ORF Transcript_84114/g.233113 Transcript_84114/m.233113 type:complete len:419 (-) Transcript_84114:63-1319(-)